MTVVDEAVRAAPGSYPVPAGRGRWRVTLHNRQFASNVSYNALLIAELVDARGRRLDRAWDSSATFTFTVDGHSPAAALIVELAHDVIVWRWDDQVGRDVAMFRGVISQAEDQVGDSHVVTFTCHDYLALFARRLTTSPLNYTQTDQDDIVNGLLQATVWPYTSSGVDLRPGSFLPVSMMACNPDGTARGASGQLRDRTYPPQSVPGDLLDDLAKVINGFDYDVAPVTASNSDSLRIFYPQQGVTRSTPVLHYGSTVAALTRTVSSADYANYWRVLGNNGSSDPAAAQLYAEIWNADATNGAPGAVGLWQSGENAADVTIQSTLNEQAAGNLALSSILMPSYTVTMRPNAYSYGNPNMGDTVPLIVQSGRLNVNTYVRVLGISYVIGDDGQEDIELTVGRPAQSLLGLLTASARTVDALARR